MRRPNARYLALGLLLCGAVAFLLFTLSSSRAPGAHRARTRKRAAAGSSAYLVPAAPAEADYARYQVILKRDVFSPPAPSPPPSPPSLPPLTPVVGPPVPPPPPPPPPPVVEPPLSFPGWSYVGYFKLDGKMYGVLRNESDRTVEELEVGESFRGAVVQQITPQEIRLKSGSREVALVVPDTFSLVPLDRAPSAAPGTAAVLGVAPAGGGGRGGRMGGGMRGGGRGG